MSQYWYKLGQAYAATKQWRLCHEISTAAKQRFPTSVGVRHLLVQCHLELGDASAAEAEFHEIEKFNPPGFASLEQWYKKTRAAGR